MCVGGGALQRAALGGQARGGGGPAAQHTLTNTTGGKREGIFELRPILMRVCTLFSAFTSASSSSLVCSTASRKYVISPIAAVFHLFAIFVKVVAPEDMRIWRTRESNVRWLSSSTRRCACAVRSFVATCCSAQMPSRGANSAPAARHFGRMRTSKPAMEKRRLGLSREYTDTKPFSHSMVVSERGSRLRSSQNVARPRLTSCFMSRMRASRGQQRLLL